MTQIKIENKIYNTIMTSYVEKTELNSKIPTFAHPGEDAGADLYSNEEVIILPGERSLVNTGIKLIPPEGSYAQISPKSGLSCKGIDIGAGVIDPGYRGEIKVLVINNSKNNFNIKVGSKIAQLVFINIAKPEFVVIDKLSDSSRKDKGFGSTGQF